MALRAAAAGALIGLGFAVKVTIALLGAGLASRRCRPAGQRLRRAHAAGAFLAAVAGGLAAGFAVVAGAALAIGGRDGFRQTVQASSMVSIGSPWRIVRTLLHLGVGEAAADDVVKTAAVVLAAVLAVLLLRGLPGAPPWGPWRRPVRYKDPSGGDADGDDAGRRVRGRSGGRRLRDWPGGRHSRSRWPGCSRGRTCCPGTTRSPGRCCHWWPPPAWTGCCWPAPRRSPSATCPPGSAGVVIPAGLGWLQSVVRTGVTPAVLAIVTIWVALSMRRGRAASPGPGGHAERGGAVASGPPSPPSARQPAAERGRAG